MNLLDKMPVYDMDGNQIQYLVQWDRGVTVRIKDTGLTEAQPVHFYHAKDECSRDVDGALDGGDLIATIPNAILRSPAPVCGFVYRTDGKQSRSVMGFRILVVPRSRPEDYDFDDRPRLYYYSYDGSELLYEEPVEEGGDGAWDGEPERVSTPQYSYAFAGWSRSTDSTAGDASATKNVTSDRNVYAAYTATVRTYTVRFYSGDGLLQESAVPYGGSAAYAGEEPAYPDGAANYFCQEDYLFTGWSPSPDGITGDTDCYAQFAQPEIEVAEIGDSWETVMAAVDAGTAVKKYRLGHYKPLEIDGIGAVTMQVIGHKNCTPVDGDAPQLTWLSMETLPDQHTFYSGSQNYTPWLDSETRAYLQDTLFPLIPDVVREHILIVVNDTQSGYNVTRTSEDSLWIPDNEDINCPCKDLLGETIDAPTTGSAVYPGTAESRIKAPTGGTEAVRWWLRRGQTGAYPDKLNVVEPSGESGSLSASSRAYVAFGFCT